MNKTIQEKFIKDSSKMQKIKIESERLKTLGLLHAWAILLIPFLGLVAAIAQVWLLGVGVMEIGLLVSMYSLTVVGVVVGFHRQFSHGSFRANNTILVILAILGSMAAQGSLIYWVANHRRHHQFTDQPGDPHSPHLHGHGLGSYLRGLWHAHIGWMFSHEFTNPLLFAKDLIRNPVISRVNRMYFWWILLGLAIPAVLGGIFTWTWWGVLSGFLWGGLVRIFLVNQFLFFINSISHFYGSHPFETGDQSRNNLWLAIPTFGAAWHNNHHAFPNSAKTGLQWWQVDLAYWLIWMMKMLGLVWDVKVPTLGMIESKKMV